MTHTTHYTIKVTDTTTGYSMFKSDIPSIRATLQKEADYIIDTFFPGKLDLHIEISPQTATGEVIAPRILLTEET